MDAVTRREIFLKAAADGEVPDMDPITREEHFLRDIAETVAGVDKPTQEQVDIAVNEYLEEHGVAFNTSAEIQEVLQG